MSRLVYACGLILALGFTVPCAFGQEFTTADILGKLDEKAKVFSSLEAPVSHVQTVDGSRHPSKAGKIYIKVAKGVPRFFWDITDPKERMKILVDKGELKMYFPNTNTYSAPQQIGQDSEMLQLLLLGFGVPSSTFTKIYNPIAKGRESLGTVQTVVLELTSISAKAGKFSKITLWLDPQSWTPVRTRVTEKSGDFTDFNYSDIRLNKGVSDSVFNLKIPSNATKQVG